MSILSKDSIIKRLGLPISDRDRLVITPLLTEPDTDAFDADSVDLRLGSHFLLPRTLAQPYYCPDTSSATSLHTRVYVPLGEYLVVPSHQTILGATLEFIKLPYNVSGEILTKSSVARTFIVVETAPWIHPEYRGCLTPEIANVSNTPVLLYLGRRIAQLILMEVDVKSQLPAKRSGSYFGPVHPEAPEFRNPEHDLLAIGITEAAVIRSYRALHGVVRLNP